MQGDPLLPGGDDNTSDEAELARLDAEIARLSLKRDELRAKIAGQSSPTSATTDGWAAPAASDAAPPTEEVTTSAVSPSAPPTGQLPPASWLPDPYGLYVYRYWDGSKWTKWVASGGKTSEDPITGPQPRAPRDPSQVSGPVAQQPTNTVQPVAQQPTSATPSIGQQSSTIPQPVTHSPSPTPQSPPQPVVDIAGAVGKRLSRFGESVRELRRKTPDLDAGQLMLLAGAVLLIGGLVGLTVWLWDRIPALGKLGIFGLAFVVQISLAWRLREKLKSTSEALAATGAATLVLIVWSLVGKMDSPLSVGIGVGLTGVALLVGARFRAWVLLGHVALLAGAASVLFEEPHMQSAVGVFFAMTLMRLVVLPASAKIRGAGMNMEERWLAVGGCISLALIPYFSFDEFGAVTAALILFATAAVASELVVRSDESSIEQTASLISAAAFAGLGLYRAGDWWWNGARVDGAAASIIVVAVCLLAWRIGRRIADFREPVMMFALALAPFAVRFLCERDSFSQFMGFCALTAVASVLVTPRLNPRLASALWAGALLASIPGIAVDSWPRLFLLAVAATSLSYALGRIELRVAAVVPASLGVAQILYTSSFSATWWFRPDAIGVSVAVFLAAVEWSIHRQGADLGRASKVPKYSAALGALVAVPLFDVVTHRAILDLPSNSLWRLCALGAFVLVAWAPAAWGHRSLNGPRLVAAAVVAVVVASRVADESSILRASAWLLLGAVFVLATLRLKKIDFLVPAAGSWLGATISIGNILYSSSFSESWWFRPDLIGAVIAVFLTVLEWTARQVLPEDDDYLAFPRFAPALIALVAAPVADVASQRALLDLPSNSVWRLCALGAFVLVAWVPAIRGQKSLNAVRLVAAGVGAVLVASRVADESSTVRASAWLLLGAAFVVATLVSKKMVLLLPAAGCWVGATISVGDVLYSSSFSVSWWFRPDVIGAFAAVCLVVLEWSARRVSNDDESALAFPRFTPAWAALVSVPVADVVSQRAVLDLPSHSVWRLCALGVFVLVAWVPAIRGPKSLNAVRLVAAGVVAVVVASRVADDSSGIRAATWLVLGAAFIVATLKSKKIVLMLPLPACWLGATISIGDVLYSSSFSESWWFRPDLIGAIVATFLVVSEWTARRVSKEDEPALRFPMYAPALVALVATPVVNVVSQRALLDLSSQSIWRLCGLGAFVLVAWAPALRGQKSLNAQRLVAAGVVAVLVVSRVGDDSLMVQSATWLLLGAACVVAALQYKKVQLVLAAAACWTIAIVVYSPAGPFEVLTLSFATVAAISALVARRIGRQGSFDFIPATALALVPSAVAAASAMLDGSVDAIQARRIIFVLIAGGISLVVGTSRRIAALVFPSLVAVVMLAVAQLIFVQQRSSNWITALVVGILLIVAGARLEYLRSLGRRGVDLLRSMR